MSDIYFSYVMRTAKKAYPCDGCHEITIRPGAYYRLTRGKVNGQWAESRWCYRCCCALEAKLAHGNTKPVEPGGLALSKLSSVFRKAWNTLTQKYYARDATHEMRVAACHEFEEAVGITGIGIRPNGKSNYQKRKARRMRKELHEMAKLQTEIKKLKDEMADGLKQLVVKFLTAKVAHMKNDPKKYDEAHGEAAAILVELQKKVMDGQEEE